MIYWDKLRWQTMTYLGTAQDYPKEVIEMIINDLIGTSMDIIYTLVIQASGCYITFKWATLTNSWPVLAQPKTFIGQFWNRWGILRPCCWHVLIKREDGLIHFETLVRQLWDRFYLETLGHSWCLPDRLVKQFCSSRSCLTISVTTLCFLLLTFL